MPLEIVRCSRYLNAKLKESEGGVDSGALRWRTTVRRGARGVGAQGITHRTTPPPPPLTHTSMQAHTVMGTAVKAAIQALPGESSVSSFRLAMADSDWQG